MYIVALNSKLHISQEKMRTTAMASMMIALADAMSFESVFEHRQLQRAGAQDTNVCGRGGHSEQGHRLDGRFSGSGAAALTGHSSASGTIHDDQTDEHTDSQGYASHPQDCYKVIVAPVGSVVSLAFSHLNLENGPLCANVHNGVGCDVVTIYDGPNEQAPVLGVYSGTDIPGALVSSGTEVTVRFETDTGNAGDLDRDN
eukprot:SAG11_NODE_10234_length_845_cov_0.915550_1_plen_199_part_01